MDDLQCNGQGNKKHRASLQNTHPIETKKAKQLQKVEEMVMHIGGKLGIVVKKEGTENDATICNGQNYVDPKIAVGDALTKIANIACAGFSSWEQSMYFQHAHDNLKQQLANACICHEIMHLESEIGQVQEAKNKKDQHAWQTRCSWHNCWACWIHTWW